MILVPTANVVMRNMMSSHSQSILLTGESGSGKTENTNQILKFLSRDSSKFKDHVEATNILLELFGNAKTYNNGNSSRFTKLSKVYFQSNQMIYLQIFYQLLESTRIYVQANDECNFHVFYSLMNSGDSDLLAQLHLDINERFTVSIHMP